MTGPAYGVVLSREEEADTICAWLGQLRDAGHLVDCRSVLAVAGQRCTLTLLPIGASSAGRTLLDVAFELPVRALILARISALPGCVAGIAQDLDRCVDCVRGALEALASLGLAYEVGGVWRARVWSRGGRA